MDEDRRKEMTSSGEEPNLVGLVLQSRRKQPSPAPPPESRPTGQASPQPRPQGTHQPTPSSPASPSSLTRRSKRAEARKIAGSFSDLATPENVLMAVAALGIGLIGLFGGWDRVGAKETSVPTLPASQPLKADPFQIKFARAYWFKSAPEVSSLALLSEHERGLLVTADVTNTGSKPVSILEVQRAFRLTSAGLVDLGQPAAAAETKPNVFRASDLLRLTGLQPGLPTRVVLVWTQDVAQPIPANLNVSVFKQTYRKSALDGSMRYFDATETAQVNLPVTEFKAR